MEQIFKKGDKLYGVFVSGEPGASIERYRDELGRDTRVQEVEYFAPSYFGEFYSRVILRENLVDIENDMLFKNEKTAKEKELDVQKRNSIKLYDDVQSLKSDIEKVKKLLVLPK